MKVAILSGTVYGAAEDVARHAEAILSAAGHQAEHMPRATAELIQAFAPEAVVGVTSTTGMGELPDALMPLYLELRETLPGYWRGLPAAIIALGDSSYDIYCGGGELLQELFLELGTTECLPMLRLDASETVTPETDAEPWLAALLERLPA